MTLQLNYQQQSILRVALNTRLQRIESMIGIYKEDNTDSAKTMIENYSQEYKEVENMLFEVRALDNY